LSDYFATISNMTVANMTVMDGHAIYADMEADFVAALGRRYNAFIEYPDLPNTYKLHQRVLTRMKYQLLSENPSGNILPFSKTCPYGRWTPVYGDIVRVVPRDGTISLGFGDDGLIYIKPKHGLTRSNANGGEKVLHTLDRSEYERFLELQKLGCWTPENHGLFPEPIQKMVMAAFLCNSAENGDMPQLYPHLLMDILKFLSVSF